MHWEQLFSAPSGFEIGAFLLLVGVFWTLQRVMSRLEAIVESQRLSTILTIAPRSLKVDPTKFEPNRERLLTLLLQQLATEDHPNPGTWAYCVLEHGSLSEFVDGETFQGIRNALARLRVNGEMDEARRFLTEVVDKL